MTTTISSAQNPKIKNIIKLHKSSERKKQGLFLIEGEKEIKHALASGYKLDACFYYKDKISDSLLTTIEKDKTIKKYEVTSEVFSKIAYRENSGGIVAQAFPKNHDLKNLSLKESPLVIVLETVEKPGNLGAILRTADAAGVDAVIISDPTTDLYNPNVIRASIGCVFSVNIASASSSTVINWLKKHKFKSYAAALQTDKFYDDYNYSGATAFVMGTESVGLTEKWRKAVDHIIKIPMLGINDSLNVSIATAVLVYEALRQRKKI